MFRGRKERTPAQLAVLAQAREKAKIVIAERAKINALQKTAPEPVSEEEPPPPPPPEPEAEPEEPPPPPTPEPVPVSENEAEEPRLTRREVGGRELFVLAVGYRHFSRCDWLPVLFIILFRTVKITQSFWSVCFKIRR